MSKIPSKKGECSYHLCKKTRAERIECKYCGKLFCPEHIKPAPPRLPNFENDMGFNEWKTYCKNHHPCVEYPKYEAEKKEEENRKIRELVARFTQQGVPSEKPFNTLDEIEPEITISEPIHDFDVCAYCVPRGNTTKKKITQCDYCKEWFCEEHAFPKKPMLAPFKSTDINERLDWEVKGGHPCVPYTDYLIKYGEPTKPPSPIFQLRPNTEIAQEPPIAVKTTADSIKITRNTTDPIDSISDNTSDEAPYDPPTMKNHSWRIKPISEKTSYLKQDTYPAFEKNEENFWNRRYMPFSSKKTTQYAHSNKYIRWFFKKKHPQSKVNKQNFFIHLLIIIALSLIFWLVYENSYALNEVVLWIFKLGAIIQICLFLFILWSIYKILVNLKYGVRGLANGFKLIAAGIVLILCLQLYLQPGLILDPVTLFDYDTLNPFEIKLDSITAGLNDFVRSDTPSFEELTTGPKNITLPYILNGEYEQIEYTAYKGLNDYLASLPRTISYYTVPPTTKDFIMRNINQKEQKEFLMPLVNTIKNITVDTDEQAKISISIVQTIPYDWSGFTTGSLTSKYPYEVLYTQRGVCGEKSELLVFLLRELGYGVATFEFTDHRAVGVKCPIQYSYDGTGYCFVESTSPTIITDSEGDYVGTGKLGSYTMIVIADGKPLMNISEEYYDAKEFNRLNEVAQSSGGILNDYDYYKWWELVNKYGITFS